MENLTVAETFNEPKDLSLSIWRYMPFNRFESLIKEGLYFRRLDLLEDSFEGSFSFGNQKIRESIMLPASNFDKLKTFSREMRKHIYISCWHINDCDSYAMWKIYSGRGGERVSIKTTARKLKENLNHVIISQIKYIDYGSYNIPETNLYNIFCYKRKAFDYEKELRAWFIEPEKHNKGITRKINVDNLIEEIYIAPNTKGDLMHRIKTLLKNNRLTKPVKQSPLDDKPLY
ncbi:MAG: hypothetical protein HZA10_01735 [Nitrospirae bacterium]|nr:hypothetical protein [Nitrospirota bacterium]